MRLDERGESQCLGIAPEPGERAIIEGGHNQQHGIGAGRTRFEQLVAVDDEVLPEQRDVHGLARGREVPEVPVEEGRLGENRDGGGPLVRIGPRDGRGIVGAGERTA